jgi:hypothetical protein
VISGVAYPRPREQDMQPSLQCLCRIADQASVSAMRADSKGPSTCTALLQLRVSSCPAFQQACKAGPSRDVGAPGYRRRAKARNRATRVTGDVPRDSGGGLGCWRRLTALGGRALVTRRAEFYPTFRVSFPSHPQAACPSLACPGLGASESLSLID